MRGRRTAEQTREERLLGEVGIVLLELLLGGSDQLDGDKLVAIGEMKY
jgi:hypothetical protein